MNIEDKEILDRIERLAFQAGKAEQPKAAPAEVKVEKIPECVLKCARYVTEMNQNMPRDTYPNLLEYYTGSNWTLRYGDIREAALWVTDRLTGRE